MVAGGVLLVIAGVIVAFLSAGGGLVGFGLGGAFGGFLVLLGVLIGAAGAIVDAVERQTKVVTSELRALSGDYRKGVESLWSQLDKVRANTAASIAPPLPILSSVPSTGPMGRCPACGKTRHPSVVKCVFCGSADAVPQ